MYEDYYRFRRQPFSPTPDPECLYKSDSHQQALEQLLRGIGRREGILLLTGDVGTGKTTTTRALLRLLDSDVFTALVLNPFLSEDELLRVLLQDFGVVSDGRVLEDASRQTLIDTLNQFLLSLVAVQARALVVVDEAQNLKLPVLEQLRVLTSLESDEQKLLQILLVGQPELQTLLGAPEMRSLNQRITRRCALRPLTDDEVEQYVAFRVRRAGDAKETMFTERALELICQFSAGVPRKINLICDRSLEVGFDTLSPTIDETLVVKAAEALELTRTTRETIRSPQSRSAGGPSRPGVAPKTKRWMAAAAGVVAGVGLGAALTLLAPWSPREPPPLSPPSQSLATLALPEPVDVDAGVPSEARQSYAIRVMAFDTRPPADAAAAMLRERGADAVVVTEGDAPRHVVWVGPYTSLADARLIETAIKQRFGFLDARIVSDGSPSNPP